MERTSLCVACTYYGTGLLSLSVDPACRSKDEADRLCGLHRARMTEGYCVLCGRREPWVSPWPQSDIGSCERCYRVVFGTEQGDWAAAELARGGSRQTPVPAEAEGSPPLPYPDVGRSVSTIRNTGGRQEGIWTRRANST